MPGAGSGSPTTGSIFSSSLNTTPKTALLAPQPTSDKSKSPTLKPSVFGSNSPALNKSAEGVQLFSSTFGQTPSSPSIFGGTPNTKVEVEVVNTPASNLSTPVFESTGSARLFGGFGSTSSTPTFGSVAANSTSVASSQRIFGSSVVSSGFSFADAAKGFDKTNSDATVGTFGTLEKSNGSETDLVNKMDSGISFASLASGTAGSFLAKQNAPNNEFVGLTVKDDVFTRMANKSKNESGGAGEHDDNEESAAGDENYDPHYEPIIQLPDKIEVRTGEEEETKLFGERAKLYRYDSDTKEWKERGVGELKILHHPGRNSYRMLMRREQIYKLVLNHAITCDMAVSPLQNSSQAFMWCALNHAEESPQLEKLATRFKNEELASTFKSVLEKCQEKLRQKPDLEPDQD